MGPSKLRSGLPSSDSAATKVDARDRTVYPRSKKARAREPLAAGEPASPASQLTIHRSWGNATPSAPALRSPLPR